MPVFATASSTRRPRNRPSASRTPTGAPSRKATTVALSETRRVSPVIAHVSSSPVSSNRNASSRPSPSTSTRQFPGLSFPVSVPSLSSQCRLVLARVRHEQALPGLLDAELADHPLCTRTRDPVGERLRAVRLDPVACALGHLDDV